ncbi:PQQ-dependent sugar dehydrogenase [Synechococcus sp. CCY 9618]|uniref:PQQ-dependent sugar dehydrogenase n=1 Tax=Synechococcus sp. CCY 9618 TaxID=2815602 RepID=UPI001C217F0A|nr:PQQ-dependent sugar dehydrogenase [Synechococcus sp. CCY 9618]
MPLYLRTILSCLALTALVPLLGGCRDAAGPSPGSTLPVQVAPSTPAVRVRAVPVVQGLEHPWSVAWLPGGDLLITERPGRLRLVRSGVLEAQPIPGVPEVFAVGQGGLLDVAPHPDFASNRLLYLTYSAGSGTANHTRLARARFEGRTLSDLKVLYAVPQLKGGAQHFGSRLLWLPDTTLLMAIGDGGNPPIRLGGELIRNQAQNPASAFGKILRFNADGTPAADGPFAATPGALPGLWSLGHRNIQGLALDPLHLRVWASEHGARGGDELNRIEEGENYGWPKVTHSREYFGPAIAEATSAPGLRDPEVVWTPAIAPSGLTLYTGDRYPGWRGDLFAGGLVSRQVHRLVLDQQGAVRDQQTIPIGARVRDVRQGPDGFLYVLTDGAGDGALLRLEPLPEGTAPSNASP